MEPNTVLLTGLGIATAAVAGWWLKNRGKTIEQIADKIEDAIEDATGIDVELDSVVETIASAAEDVAEDVVDDVEEALEAGESIEDVVDAAVDSAVESATEEIEDLKALTVAQLKERLKELNLPITGKKADLLARLQEALA
ncbi:MAG: SAP domain-containing protein [Candidatus Thorarchaeota archaeon]